MNKRIGVFTLSLLLFSGFLDPQAFEFHQSRVVETPVQAAISAAPPLTEIADNTKTTDYNTETRTKSQVVQSVSSVEKVQIQEWDEPLEITLENREPDWDLTGVDLSPAEIKTFTGRKTPSAIHFNDGIQTHIVQSKSTSSTPTNGRVLFLSNETATRNTQMAREANMAARNYSPPPAPPPPAPPPPGPGKPLSPTAYELVSFVPGKRDNGLETIRLPKIITVSIQGPDYSLDAIDVTDASSLEELRSRVVSLGHGGEITLKVLGNGFISNLKGFDFKIFENAFRYESGKIYQEFARVGVSESEDPASFQWFPCDPRAGQILGCAGAVPTAEGGDAFDLSELKMARARYIKIQDVGYNFNRGPNTEGFDLDAILLIHAFE